MGNDIISRSELLVKLEDCEEWFGDRFSPGLQHAISLTKEIASVNTEKMRDKENGKPAVDVASLVDEVERLRAQVYNLTLYLNYAFDFDYAIHEEAFHHYDGLPGYCPKEFGIVEDDYD